MASEARAGGVLPNHVGLVVKDIDKTAKLLSKMLGPFGIGPWKFDEDISRPGELFVPNEHYKLKVAYAKVQGLGLVEIELLQQTEGNLYTEFLKKGEGWHHIAFAVDNYNEMVSHFKQAGGKVVLDVLEVGKHYVYIETPGGYIIELMEK